MEARQFAQEGGVVIGQAIAHFIHHRQLAPPQDPRLPKRQDGATDALLRIVPFFRSQAVAVALVEQAGDLPLAVEDALALHFGGVSGEHRLDRRRGEEITQACRRDATAQGTRNAVRQTTLFGWRGSDGGGARAADVMLVLGDVGQLRKIGERTHYKKRLLTRKGVEQFGELRSGGSVVVAMRADRLTANALDNGESVLAFLLPDGVAKQAAEKADIVPQRFVVVRGKRVQ